MNFAFPTANIGRKILICTAERIWEIIKKNACKPEGPTSNHINMYHRLFLQTESYPHGVVNRNLLASLLARDPFRHLPNYPYGFFVASIAYTS